VIRLTEEDRAFMRTLLETRPCPRVVTVGASPEQGPPRCPSCRHRVWRHASGACNARVVVAGGWHKRGRCGCAVGAGDGAPKVKAGRRRERAS